MSESRSATETTTVLARATQRVVSCITPSIIQRRQQPSILPTFELGYPEPVRIGRRGALLFTVRVSFALQISGNDLIAAPASYTMHILSLSAKELLAYHWHPTGASPVTTPHLHVAATLDGQDISKRHLPTGYVSIPNIVRMLITECQIEPLRNDWARVLDEAERAFHGA